MDPETWDDTVICKIATEDQVQAILFIPLAKSPIPDTKIWRLEGSSMYIMKSDYKLLVQGKSDFQQALSNPMAFSEKDFFSELWALQFSEKIKITMWKFYNNFMSAYSNLNKRHISSYTLCPLYHTDQEFVDQLL